MLSTEPGKRGLKAAKRVATREARAEARTQTRAEFERQGIIAPDENLRGMAQQRPQYAAGKAAQAATDVERLQATDPQRVKPFPK